MVILITFNIINQERRRRGVCIQILMRIVRVRDRQFITVLVNIVNSNGTLVISPCNSKCREAVNGKLRNNRFNYFFVDLCFTDLNKTSLLRIGISYSFGCTFRNMGYLDALDIDIFSIKVLCLYGHLNTNRTHGRIRFNQFSACIEADVKGNYAVIRDILSFKRFFDIIEIPGPLTDFFDLELNRLGKSTFRHINNDEDAVKLSLVMRENLFDRSFLLFQKFFFCKLFFQKVFFREVPFCELIQNQLRKIGNNRVLRNVFGLCVFTFRNRGGFFRFSRNLCTF